MDVLYISDMSEIELKFLLDKKKSSEIWARAKASKLTRDAPITRTLRSIYLDTPEHALKKAGIALRLRRDGRRWIQGVKTGRTLHGGLSQGGELETPAPGGRVCLDAIPDPAVREAIVDRVNGALLQPVCETVIKRSTGELTLADGTRAELAVDVGEVRAGERSAELSELEIELLDGNASGLFDIASILVPEGGLRFSRLSKAARGYLLAEEGRIDVPLAPRTAENVALDPSQTAEQAAREVLRECLDQIATNVLVVRQMDDIEGPHQLRVGLRRLRSAFSVYAPVLRSPAMKRLDAEARWFGREVGALRDLDVVANDMARREAERHPDEPELSALADLVVRQAQERRALLRKLLEGARAQAFLIDLARFVETRGWLAPLDFGQTERLGTPIATLARQSLAKRWKRVAQHAHGLETLSVEQRHELRKQLKKLRYAVEFFCSLFPTKRVDPFLKRLKKLQTVFGDLNDAATLKTMFTGADVPGAGDPSIQRAIGWMVGASQARAEFGWIGAKDLWKDLERVRPFWR
ncbi:MAG: CHAD domain-containing protein [Methylocystis sp.]